MHMELWPGVLFALASGVYEPCSGTNYGWSSFGRFHCPVCPGQASIQHPVCPGLDHNASAGPVNCSYTNSRSIPFKFCRALRNQAVDVFAFCHIIKGNGIILDLWLPAELTEVAEYV